MEDDNKTPDTGVDGDVDVDVGLHKAYYEGKVIKVTMEGSSMAEQQATGNISLCMDGSTPPLPAFFRFAIPI